MNYFILLVGLLIIGAKVNCHRTKRIIGSGVNKIENVPYTLSLRSNGSHICGATVIGEQWALTAAHCCRGTLLTVRSNSSYLFEGGVVHNVTSYLPHHKYGYGNDNYDICILQVAPNFSKNQVVALPDPAAPLSVNLTRGQISGWGPIVKDSKVLSPTIRSANVTRVDLLKCKFLYRNHYTVHNTNSCYGNGTSDACPGDSGGPLVNDDRILIGIISFGYECGFLPLPGVYVDIMQFRAWIKNTIGI